MEIIIVKTEEFRFKLRFEICRRSLHFQGLNAKLFGVWRFFDELKDDCSMGEFGGAYELFIGFVLLCPNVFVPNKVK